MAAYYRAVRCEGNEMSRIKEIKMQSLREQSVARKSLDVVAEFMAGVTPGSPNDQVARAEFLLRQTEFQRDAAAAAKETAIYTQRYTRYMFWSVVILALSAAGTLLMSVLTYIAS